MGVGCPIGKVSASGRGGILSSKSDSIKDPPCKWIWCTLNLTSWVKCWRAAEVRDEVEAQASSSSSDRSLNHPRVVSKLGVNLTKINPEWAPLSHRLL
ncbi:hypothetical protein AVEN_129885-1 [Araneus ventricosus]|uniref:Uncharacterized protein n=1 Tax=Araneus ventricosus TaxID=182803 RepID=A0A4Y2N073_ARAVE|nr:hypothetical protein AVEN_57618-1 [Araneus ventricosus]GBN32024.1 hypothetical protein AVEN_129885-1 [Araneus ventricosus]